jgi:hypothetical protein
MFQLSGFRITQVLPSCSNHVRLILHSVLDLWLFNIGWCHQRLWLTVCQVGSFVELPVATDSIQDPHGYLAAVSNQDPGYAESFGLMCLRTRFSQVIFHFEGHSTLGITNPLHYVGINHWSLPGRKVGVRSWGSIAIHLFCKTQHLAL